MTTLQLVNKQTKQTPNKQPRRVSRETLRRMRWQRFAGCFAGSVAVTLVAISLSHLASGVEILTHSTPPLAWATAVGIDLGFIGAEMAILCAATDKVRREVERLAKPTIIGTMIGSALMNAFAFAAKAASVPQLAAACALGAAVPALIYVLTRLSTGLLMAAR